MYLELLKILFASLIICDCAPNQRENLVFPLFILILLLLGMKRYENRRYTKWYLMDYQDMRSELLLRSYRDQLSRNRLENRKEMFAAILALAAGKPSPAASATANKDVINANLKILTCDGLLNSFFSCSTTACNDIHGLLSLSTESYRIINVAIWSSVSMLLW